MSTMLEASIETKQALCNCTHPYGQQVRFENSETICTALGCECESIVV